MNFGTASTDAATPEDATNDFLNAISSCSLEGTSAYLDNNYVRFLVNSTGSDEELNQRNDALFQNFNFEVVDTAEKGNIAVAKVRITNADFSSVLSKYEDSSEDYIMENLYTDDITDKDKLAAKCLELYVDEVQSAADASATKDFEFYLPMHRDDTGQWLVDIDDKIMKGILGDLELPESED